MLQVPLRALSLIWILIKIAVTPIIILIEYGMELSQYRILPGLALSSGSAAGILFLLVTTERLYDAGQYFLGFLTSVTLVPFGVSILALIDNGYVGVVLRTSPEEWTGFIRLVLKINKRSKGESWVRVWCIRRVLDYMGSEGFRQLRSRQEKARVLRFVEANLFNILEDPHPLGHYIFTGEEVLLKKIMEPAAFLSGEAWKGIKDPAVRLRILEIMPVRPRFSFAAFVDFCAELVKFSDPKEQMGILNVTYQIMKCCEGDSAGGTLSPLTELLNKFPRYSGDARLKDILTGFETAIGEAAGDRAKAVGVIETTLRQISQLAAQIEARGGTEAKITKSGENSNDLWMEKPPVRSELRLNSDLGAAPPACSMSIRKASGPWRRQWPMARDR